MLYVVRYSSPSFLTAEQVLSPLSLSVLSFFSPSSFSLFLGRSFVVLVFVRKFWEALVSQRRKNGRFRCIRSMLLLPVDREKELLPLFSFFALWEHSSLTDGMDMHRGYLRTEEFCSNPENRQLFHMPHDFVLMFFFFLTRGVWECLRDVCMVFPLFFCSSVSLECLEHCPVFFRCYSLSLSLSAFLVAFLSVQNERVN